MVGILFCLVYTAFAQQILEIEDGMSMEGNFDALFGGHQDYKYKIPENWENESSRDLSITLTTFQDWSDPDIYVRFDEVADTQNFDRESVAWGMGAITIPPQDMDDHSDVYIHVSCYTYCSYTVTVSLAEEIKLTDSTPISAFLDEGVEQLYQFKTGSEVGDKLTFTAMTSSGVIDLFVIEASDIEDTPEPDNTLEIEELIGGGKSCTITNPKPYQFYRAAVVAESMARFTITAQTSEGVVKLQASVPVHGEVEEEKFQYYVVDVANSTQDMMLQLTPYTGEADMYVMADEKPTMETFDFMITHYQNETMYITREDRENISHPSGPYYIGVYGYHHSTYALYVSLNETSIIPLVPGVFQSGYVEQNMTKYYYLELPDSDLDYEIMAAVTRSSGSPDLFIKLCTDVKESPDCRFTEDEIQNPESNWDLTFQRSGYADTMIELQHRHTQCQEDKPCSYVIAVHGDSEEKSSFSIISSYNEETELSLRQGKSVTNSLARNSYKYYKYTVSNSKASRVEFKLSPLTGDSNLYVTRNSTKASKEDYEKASEKSIALMDIVDYNKGEDGDTLEGTYHISVYGILQSTFSLVASETIPGQNSTTTLLPGKAQRDTVTAGDESDFKIYTFDLHYTEETAQPFRVHVTPMVGKFDLFVSNSPSNLDIDADIFYYDWCDCNNATASEQERTVSVEIDDPYYLPTAKYLVLVMGTEFGNDGTATYSITYTSGGGQTNLQEGIAWNDEVEEKEYKYYKFPINQNHEDISIAITALTGDPDLYVAVGNKKPTKENNDRAFSSYGSELGTLIWEEDLKENCPDLPDEPIFGSQIHCDLYLGVFGFEKSSYSIKITGRKDLPSQLTLGDPEYGEVGKTQYRYYYLITSASKSVDLVLAPLEGDVDLFVNILDQTEAGNRVEDWTRPNKDEADLKSQSAVFNEEIDIGGTMMKDSCPSGQCVIVIGVFCFDQTCQFNLNSSSDEMFTLAEGVPQQAHVEAGQYNKYRFYNDLDKTNILFTITVLDDGDPDLYVSKGRGNIPSLAEYDWSSASWGGEHLLIAQEDEFFKNNNTTMTGQYVISVFGYIECSYIITAINNEDLLTRLHPGVPVHAISGKNDERYFYYLNTRDENVQFTLTPRGCKTTLTATTQIPVIESLYQKLPSMQNYTWSTTYEAEQHQIIVDKTDENFCSICNYVLGVFTEDQTCTYTLVANNDIHYVYLANGVAYRGSVHETGMDYFMTNVTNKGDLSISVSTYSGEAELYVGLEEITRLNYNWSSVTNDTTEHVEIADAQGAYYIGVYGYYNSEYSITAHTATSFVHLVEGWPQTYTLSYNQNDALFFKYNIIEDESDKLSCHITSQKRGFTPHVYINYYDILDKSNTQKPGPNNAQWSYNITATYDDISMSFPGGTGHYEIGVYGGGRGNEDQTGQFQITCSGIGSATVLYDQEKEYGEVSRRGDFKRYEVYAKEEGTMVIELIPCSGKVGLQVSNAYNTYNETSYMHSVNEQGTITAIIPEARGKYYLTVSAGVEPHLIGITTYRITSTMVKSGETLPQQIVPGNEGFWEWEWAENDKIIMNWSEPTFEDGSPTGALGIRYVVVSSHEPEVELLMMSSCGMKTTIEKEYGIILHTEPNELTASVKLGDDESKHIINIMALVEYDNRKVVRVAYRPMEVVTTEESSSSSYKYNAYWPIVLGVVTGLFAVALILSLILWRKYKRMERQLDYEMSDVRNVAGITSPNLEGRYISSINKPSYGELHEESR